jgi:hypothetical protein
MCSNLLGTGIVTQTTTDFVRLALDEEIDTVMLIGQFKKE